MNTISSTSLARAATLAGNLEVLRAELTTVQSKADDLRKQIEPLETELNNIMGTVPKACKRADGTEPTRHFSAEQKARISAGLKASWERRKANAPVANPSATVAVPAGA